MTNNNGRLKLAIQKEGRLTVETLEFLRKSGLEFDSFKQRLLSTCRNFPTEILFVRANDIAEYVKDGTVDVGIVGQNLLYERQAKVKKLLNLRFGFCQLILAVPKESTIKNLSQLKGKKIATSYPLSTKSFLKKNNINATVVVLSGSVEVAPLLGLGDAVVDLTSTGSTLTLNDLRMVEKIYDSEAVLIANEAVIKDKEKKILLKKLLLRFSGVLSAQKYKYVLMNAPEKIVPRLIKVIPGLKTPVVSSFAKNGGVSIATVIKEDAFWETVDRLQKIGVTGITVLPIEKMIF